MNGGGLLGRGRAALNPMILIAVLLLGWPRQLGAEQTREGKLSIGVSGLQHTLDAIRFGDLRPAQHSDFGGRAELLYSVVPEFSVVLAGHRARSHFHYDTGFEKGNWRDSDWGVELGPDLHLARMGGTRLSIGGSAFYGEARSRLSIANPGIGSAEFDGPTTFLVGGRGVMTVSHSLLSRLEGAVQLGCGLYKARARAVPSGNLYEWNGRSVTVTAGLRFIVIPRRDVGP